MNIYNPDKWVIIKFTLPNETTYKVLGSWSGGYLDGDSYRMNSGIVGVRQEGDYYFFIGGSGSEYKCHKDAYGMHSYSVGIFDGILERAKEHEWEVELLDGDDDFSLLEDHQDG